MKMGQVLRKESSENGRLETVRRKRKRKRKSANLIARP